MLLLIVAVATFSSCTGAQKSASAEPKAKSNSGTYQSLIDYIRRYPSVRITGTGEDAKVMIRSADTISGDGEALYVIDKSTYAHSYSEAARLVDVNDIKSVAVLQSVEAIMISYAQALLVDRKKLSEAQVSNDVTQCQEILQAAFRTDLRPLVAEARLQSGGALAPLNLFRQLGVREQLVKERGSKSVATGL